MNFFLCVFDNFFGGILSFLFAFNFWNVLSKDLVWFLDLFIKKKKDFFVLMFISILDDFLGGFV
jgi:hypothetical protein